MTQRVAKASRKTARLFLNVAPAERRELEQAAALAAESLSQFIRTAVGERAARLAAERLPVLLRKEAP